MNKKIWDLYAPFYEKAMRADKKIYSMMYRRIPKVIKGKYVLEVATGPGMLAKNVAYSAEKIVAVDYSEKMIETAKKGKIPKNLTFETADATALPYDDNSFDAVIIANALHVMPEPQKALSEIDRVLKKDGILIAPNFINHKKTLWSYVLKLAGIKFEHQWSESEYKKFLYKNGWKVIRSKKMDALIPLLYTECTRRKHVN